MDCPHDLLRKLEIDGGKLGAEPNPYDIFNFVVTAAVLAEWIQKAYGTNSLPEPFAAPNKHCSAWRIPPDAESWMNDLSCIPNPHNGVIRHIVNALSICYHTANASKHFYWHDGSTIQAIGIKPPIRGWYQWTFTSRQPDLYVTIKGENYGLKQLKGILLQFYRGLLGSLAMQDDKNGAR